MDHNLKYTKSFIRKITNIDRVHIAIGYVMLGVCFRSFI